MRKYSYSFLKTALLPAELLSVTNALSELKVQASARKENYPRIFAGLEGVARVQSVKSSNAIEGIVTSDARIREIVTKSCAPLSHSEMEIAGYRDALNMIHKGHEHLDFREADILELHRVLLSYTPQGGGTYKVRDNLIIDVNMDGTRSVRFTPVSASETAAAMNQITLAYMEARDDAGINQLLLIPCVILDFLCIHPFADGNGRMSRLMSLLLMYRNGLDAGKYTSFEEQINNSKGAYYSALSDSSAGWLSCSIQVLV